MFILYVNMIRNFDNWPSIV